MKVALASTSLLALPTLRTLEDSGYSITGLITKPDAKQGRGQVIVPNELVLNLGDSYPVYKVGNQSEIIRALTDMAADVVVTVSFGNLIRKEALALPKYGWLNLHFSLLPNYRGAAPVQWSIRNGEKESGITVFRLDEGMDTGPIFVTERIELTGKETSGELLADLSVIGAGAVIKALEMIQAGESPTPQVGVPSMAPKLTKGDAKLDWQESPEAIDQIVRAMNPEPLAWAEFRNSRIRIGRVEIVEGAGEPGAIIDPINLTVATGEGAVRIREIQPEGKRMMSALDWLRGARLTDADRFL